MPGWGLTMLSYFCFSLVFYIFMSTFSVVFCSSTLSFPPSLSKSHMGGLREIQWLVPVF